MEQWLVKELCYLTIWLTTFEIIIILQRKIVVLYCKWARIENIYGWRSAHCKKLIPFFLIISNLLNFSIVFFPICLQHYKKYLQKTNSKIDFYAQISITFFIDICHFKKQSFIFFLYQYILLCSTKHVCDKSFKNLKF